MLVAYLAVAAAIVGDPTFDEGVKLFDDLEYEQALVKFQEIASRSELANSDRATVLIYVGLSHAGMGDMDAAKRVFADAIAADRDVALPPRTPPPIVELVTELRAQAKPPEPPPPAPPTPAPPVSDTAKGPSFLGVTLTIAGSVTSAGAIAFGAIAAATYADALDKDKFADEAQAAVDAANVELIAAGILAPIGVALTVAGALMIATE